MKIITPQEEYKINNIKAIFLAGTIDDGNSINWQKELIDKLSNTNLNIEIYNPRVSKWNPNATNADIEYQIKWEQDHLDKADLIIMYLADNSKSPISLLELGLYASSKKLIVFCTDNFYRFVNVKLTCEKYNIELIQSTDINVIINKIEQKLYNNI